MGRPTLRDGARPGRQADSLSTSRPAASTSSNERYIARRSAAALRARADWRLWDLNQPPVVRRTMLAHRLMCEVRRRWFLTRDPSAAVSRQLRPSASANGQRRPPAEARVAPGHAAFGRTSCTAICWVKLGLTFAFGDRLQVSEATQEHRGGEEDEPGPRLQPNPVGQTDLLAFVPDLRDKFGRVVPPVRIALLVFLFAAHPRRRPLLPRVKHRQQLYLVDVLCHEVDEAIRRP